MPNQIMELLPRTMKVHALLCFSFIASCSLLFPFIGFAQETVQETAEVAQESVEKPVVDDVGLKQMIRDLGSETYAVRQHASEQLWNLGSAAKPALKLAAEESDSEVAKRARQILEVFEMGIDAETNPEVAQLVIRFNNSGKPVRSNILRNLVRDDRFELAFKLLEQVDKVQQQAIFREIMSLDDTLIRLARADRWADFEFLFSHPVTFQHDRTVTVFYHLVHNSLDELIEKQKSEILEKEADGKTLTSQELYSLISMLRLTGEYEEAELFAKKNPDEASKFASLHRMWMEQGQWGKVAEVMVAKDVPVRPEDGKLILSESQRALVHHFNNDEPAVQAVIDGLNKKRDEFKSNEDKDGVENIRKVLLQIGMATLNWELIEANFDMEDKNTVFDIYDYSRRTDKGFEVLDLGSNVEERNLWFNRRLRTIRSLKAKIKRLDDKNEDTDEADTELEETWRLCFDIAEKLQQLGFDNEAALHYSNLFSAMDEDESYSRRSQVLSGLMTLERYDDVWKLIERGFTGQERTSVLYVLFPKKYSQARYWSGKLAGNYRNPIDRLKAVSGMLNSPLGTLPGLNIENELSRLRVNETDNRIGYVDYQTHLVYLYHGKHELSERYRQMAGELGYSIVKKSMAKEALDRNDIESAIEYYDESWKQRTATVEALLASEAYRMQGDERNAKLRKCLAYAFWRDSYRNTTTINALQEAKKTSLIEGFIHIDVCSPYGKNISNERYRLTLADAQVDSNPWESVVNRRIVLFNSCAKESSDFPSTLAYNAIQTNLGLAKVAIGKKDFDTALKFLLQINSFAPGDPSTGEKLIAELDKAGGTEQADELFEAITEPYFAMIAKYPDSPLYRNDYSWVCACANRRTEHMLRHVEIASSKRGNFSNYVDTLAEVNFLLGNKEKAIQLARRCIALDPAKLHYREQLKRFSEE